MWPFGCRGHDFDSGKFTGKIRTKKQYKRRYCGMGDSIKRHVGYKLQKQVKRRCQHDGCRKTKKVWTTVGVYAKNADFSEFQKEVFGE